MKALVNRKYGPPDVLKLEEVEKPAPKENEVLIKIHATSLNSSDNEILTGTPFYVRMWGLIKPKYNILGSDIAGRVDAVGRKVTMFEPGDEVFGDLFERWGGLAEYVCAPENTLMLKPQSMGFDEIAAMPQASTVALQGLRFKGQIRQGQHVLINGAGGGAGSYAIQIAKLFGAEVTGVDHTEKLDAMRSIGADHVIDYTQNDFTENGQQYDRILDFVASHPVLDYKRALKPQGIYVMVGGSMARIFKMLFLGSWISVTRSKKMGILGHQQNHKDLAYMIELHEAGKVVPVIDKHFPLSDAAEAFRYLGEGHAKGKIVISM